MNSSFVSTAANSTPTVDALPQSSGDDMPSPERIPRHLLPRLSDFPIPAEIQAGGKGWGPQMIEMADHIGARAVLVLSEKLGGRELYVPRSVIPGPLLDTLGLQKAQIMSRVYGTERIQVSPARTALAQARRASVIAAVRAQLLTVGDAAIIIGSARSYVSHLVNNTEEGVGVEPAPLPRPRELRLVEDAADIAVEALLEVGAPPPTAERVCAEIIDLWSRH